MCTLELAVRTDLMSVVMNATVIYSNYIVQLSTMKKNQKTNGDNTWKGWTMDRWTINEIVRTGWCWPWQICKIIELYGESMIREANFARMIGNYTNEISELRNLLRTEREVKPEDHAGQ